MSDDILGSAYFPFKKLDLTYKVANYPSKAKLSKPSIDGAIAAAFAKWQVASPFKFQPITSGTPDITLSFGNVPRNAVYGVTYWQEHRIVFDGSRTWIDTEVIWFTDQPDLLSVAVHEIGHVLGLPDNDIDESVMQFTINSTKLAKYRQVPIPQVDINVLNSVNASLFSEYYAKQGQVKWWKRPRSFSIPSWLPELPIGWTQPPSGATALSFYQVSAGVDDTVWALDGYHNAYDYGLNEDGKHWTCRGRRLSFVAVFDFRLVLGILVNEYNELYGDLQRYDYTTQKWISVDKGSLGSSAKFKHVAVGGTKGSEEVWAVVIPRPKQRPTVADEDIEVVRYNGDITSGKGDWQVMAHRDRHLNFPINVGDETGPMHELGIGRRSTGEVVIYGMLPTYDFRTPSIAPRNFYQWRWDGEYWQHSGRDKSIPPVPPDSFVETMSEVSRWWNARRTFSVGNDGTIVAIMGDRAFRRLPEGGLWHELSHPGARWIDISVIDKSNMWGVDWNRDIFSTIV